MRAVEMVAGCRIENNDPASSLHLACSNNPCTVNKIRYVIKKNWPGKNLDFGRQNLMTAYHSLLVIESSLTEGCYF